MLFYPHIHFHHIYNSGEKRIGGQGEEEIERKNRSGINCSHGAWLRQKDTALMPIDDK